MSVEAGNNLVFDSTSPGSPWTAFTDRPGVLWEAATICDTNNSLKCGCEKAEILAAEDVAYGIIIPVISLVGIPLNLLNLIVFCQSALAEVYFTFLMALTAADLVCLVINLPIGLSRSRLYSQPTTTSAKLYDVYVYHPLGNTSATLSIWITMTLTIERLIAVRKCALASKAGMVGRARAIIVALATLAVLLNTPWFFSRQISTDGAIHYTAWSHTANFAVYSWVRFTLAKAIPCFLVSIFNAFLIFEVWLSHKRRKVLTLQRTGDALRLAYQFRLAVMLIFVSAGFMIGHIPESFAQAGIFRSMFGYCSVFTADYQMYRLVCNCLEVASYAYNFVVYMSCNQQFRQVLKRTLSWRQLKKVYRCNNIAVWPASVKVSSCRLQRSTQKQIMK